MKRRIFGLLGAAALITATLPVGSAQAATPLCWGKTPNIVGTSGPDQIDLRDGVVDIVWAGGGDDVVRGSGENGPRTDVGDWICGGPGKDRVFGSAGPDHINGGDQDDDVEGWRGADVTQGNAGSDFVTDDPIDSNDIRNDTLRGGPGNDQVIGGWGADKLYGQGGADTVIDAECDGPTLVSGGGGNDQLESYWSSFDGIPCASFGSNNVADKLNGGDGTDAAKATRNDTRDSVESVSFPTTQ